MPTLSWYEPPIAPSLSAQVRPWVGVYGCEETCGRETNMNSRKTECVDMFD
jgi:hypothetical protein